MSEFVPKKGWLVGRVIPLNKAGDPEFTLLGTEGLIDWADLSPSGEIREEVLEGAVWEAPEGSVHRVFSPEEIVYLVNKALYALAYQREHHKKRAAAEREALAPIKEKVKSLFGVSYLKATDEQLRVAAMEVKAEKEGE